MSETNTVPLYRVENPNIPAQPDGVTSHEDLVGQWFTPDIETALNILRVKKATQAEGAQLVVADLPTDQLEAHHVSKHPIAATMENEPNNYIIPRDGRVPTASISLDETLGELRGNLVWRNSNEVMRRVVEKLGETSID